MTIPSRRKPRRLTAAERRSLRLTAYHEAGHAVVAHALWVRLHRVTIKPSRHRLVAGYVTNSDRFPKPRGLGLAWYRRSDIPKVVWGRQIKILLAGPMAEGRAANRRCSPWPEGGESDVEQIFDLLGQIYEEGFVGQAWLKWLMAETDVLLDRTWDQVARLADALLVHETLTGREAAEIIQPTRRVAPISEETA